MKVLILLDTIATPDENHADFANSFLDKGWEVSFGHINTLSTHNYRVYGDVASPREKVRVYENLSGLLPVSHQDLECYDLVWVMAYPHPGMSKDIWQILWMLSRRVPFANSVESLVFLNNKNVLGQIVPPEHLPETYISNRGSDLIALYERGGRERWIAKPTNASCGSSVYILRPDDSNARVILQSMTGNIIFNPLNNQTINDERQLGLQNQYGIIQAYCQEVKDREKRVIFAGGTVVGQVGRHMGGREHRANYAQGGTLHMAELTSEEAKLCTLLARRFHEYGVNFVGIDLAYPYVLEFNISNPGGLSEIRAFTGQDLTSLIIERILAALAIGICVS